MKKIIIFFLIFISCSEHYDISMGTNEDNYGVFIGVYFKDAYIPCGSVSGKKSATVIGYSAPIPDSARIVWKVTSTGVEYDVKIPIALPNKRYGEKFHFIFTVCRGDTVLLEVETVPKGKSLL